MYKSHKPFLEKCITKNVILNSLRLELELTIENHIKTTTDQHQQTTTFSQIIYERYYILLRKNQFCIYRWYQQNRKWTCHSAWKENLPCSKTNNQQKPKYLQLINETAKISPLNVWAKATSTVQNNQKRKCTNWIFWFKNTKKRILSSSREKRQQ